MIAVDINLRVHAHRQDSPWFAQARGALRSLVEGTGTWAVPWPCLHEFLAISTHAKIYRPPTPLPRAMEQVAALLASPSLVVLSEPVGYWPVLGRLLKAGRVPGARVHDARIAALCLCHGVSELWTVDRDFTRFPELNTQNPLVRYAADPAPDPTPGARTMPTALEVKGRRQEFAARIRISLRVTRGEAGTARRSRRRRARQ